MTKHETKEPHPKTRTVLLVDDDVDFAHSVQAALQQDRQNTYCVLWKRTGNDAIHELQVRTDIQIILLEYFLPDQTGLEVVRKVSDLRLHKPIIFFSVNKDFDIAVEIMKCGVNDYLVKNEFSLQRLPAVISRVYDDYRQREEAVALEVTRQRIAAMRDLIAKVVNEIEQPISEMEKIISRLNELTENRPYRRFIDILAENVSRINQRVEKLRTLNTDKTVRYIKDIRMIDLS
jgi:DNA-binding NtrC family response regulator